MTDIPKHLEKAWQALNRGDWDGGTEAEMTELEAAINQDEESAGELAGRRALPDGTLAENVPAAGERAEPESPSWEGVWDNITRAVDRSRSDYGFTSADGTGSENNPTAESVRNRVEPAHNLRWYGLGSFGLAAAIALAFIWWPFPDSATGRLRLATTDDTIIESVEVYDGMSFLVSAGDESDVPVIWVVEE